jgi:hypothetical protein
MPINLDNFWKWLQTCPGKRHDFEYPLHLLKGETKRDNPEDDWTILDTDAKSYFIIMFKTVKEKKENNDDPKI